jgi:lipopolysaccharide/colanic/teichoic acid biosynthesis glycosyltransferase
MTSAALSPVPATLRDESRTSLPRSWRGKRVFDIAVSLVLLVLCLPPLLLIAAAILVTSRGPVFFRQRRVGLGGAEFRILKFRTMQVGAEELLAQDPALLQLYLAGGHKIPRRRDPRVTRLGRLLRRSSLDELPQLFNVLRGEMSLIGPRPVRPDELEQYRDVTFAYLELRPGLTGLWQVSGRSDIAFPRRAEIDAEYYQRCSLRTDLGILARTVVAVLACRGAA